VVGALALTSGLAAVVGIVVLFSGGGDGSDATVTPGPAFSPSNADEAAISVLAQKSIEVMPRNQWPSLYGDFTYEFQARCPQDEFIQSGIDAAQEQGANLSRLGFVRLENVSVGEDQATATIIGEVKGSFEYEVYAAFQKQEGQWKLAPADGTSGCQAFNRP